MMTDLFITVLDVSASVSLVVLLLILFSPLLNRRYASKWKYLVWIFLAVRLLILSDGVDGRSVVDMVLGWKEHIVSKVEQSEADIVSAEPVPQRLVVEIPARMTVPLKAQSKKNITPLDICAFLWATGSLLFMVVHITSYLHYKRRVMKNGKPLKEAAILQQLLKIKRELHIRHIVPVIEFSEVASPMLLGFFRPVLVLPDEEYSAKEIYFILKHELVHVKRGDVYWKLLLVAANGVHWFNPLIWIMQREAVVDMELSCDEKVTRGEDLATKKAYTETLLSTLHKGCSKRIVLSTGFYGGKQIMKKRFQNILRKTGKKNGFSILVLAVALTICTETLVGCSVAKENTGEKVYWKRGAQSEVKVSSENLSAEESVPEDVITLTIMKEGMKEEKQAALVVDNGEFSFYLPEGEWQKKGSAMWYAMANEDVKLWAAGFESGYPIKQVLVNDNYVPDETGMTKEDNGLHYKARLYEEKDKLWLVEYCYPVEAEEGWRSELAVIADTFAVISENSEQVLGYITDFGGGTVTIDRQDWVVPETPDWQPEYNLDVGFEIVDLEGEDAVYPIRNDCKYFILENHQGESAELDAEAFEKYWRETEFPIFWSVELENGEVVSFAEWYRP